MNDLSTHISLQDAFVYSIAMGAVIFFCRSLPFVFFINSGKEKSKNKKSAADKMLGFVEIISPPVAMTVLTFDKISASLLGGISLAGINLHEVLPVIAASIVTAILHLWKRNSLLSIFCGTALFMFLDRIV